MRRMVLFMILIGLIGLSGCGEKKEIKFDDCQQFLVGEFTFYIPENLKYDDYVSDNTIRVFTNKDAHCMIGLMKGEPEETEENVKIEESTINGYDVTKYSYSSKIKGMDIQNRHAYINIDGKLYYVMLSWKNGDYQPEFDAILRFTLED